jgi:hypothetical protein
MTGAHICRRYARPFSIKPCLSQRSEYNVQPVRSDRCNVLQDDVSRSHQANDSHEFVEEAGTGALLDAGLLACGADVLAGEASANNVS